MRELRPPHSTAPLAASIVPSVALGSAAGRARRVELGEEQGDALGFVVLADRRGHLAQTAQAAEEPAVRRVRPAHVPRAAPTVGPQGVEPTVVADAVGGVPLDRVAPAVAERPPGGERARVTGGDGGDGVVRRSRQGRRAAASSAATTAGSSGGSTVRGGPEENICTGWSVTRRVYGPLATLRSWPVDGAPRPAGGRRAPRHRSDDGADPRRTPGRPRRHTPPAVVGAGAARRGCRRGRCGGLARRRRASRRRARRPVDTDVDAHAHAQPRHGPASLAARRHRRSGAGLPRARRPTAGLRCATGERRRARDECAGDRRRGPVGFGPRSTRRVGAHHPRDRPRRAARRRRAAPTARPPLRTDGDGGHRCHGDDGRHGRRSRRSRSRDRPRPGSPTPRRCCPCSTAWRSIQSGARGASRSAAGSLPSRVHLVGSSGGAAANAWSPTGEGGLPRRRTDVRGHRRAQRSAALAVPDRDPRAVSSLVGALPVTVDGQPAGFAGNRLAPPARRASCSIAIDARDGQRRVDRVPTPPLTACVRPDVAARRRCAEWQAALARPRLSARGCHVRPRPAAPSVGCRCRSSPWRTPSSPRCSALGVLTLLALVMASVIRKFTAKILAIALLVGCGVRGVVAAFGAAGVRSAGRGPRRDRRRRRRDLHVLRQAGPDGAHGVSGDPAGQRGSKNWASNGR